MKTGPAGLALIKEFEGLFLQAYDDANEKVVPSGGHCIGTLTIGWGLTTSAGPPRIYPGMVITRPEAEDILASDLTSVELEVIHLARVSLTQNQFDALVSFQFNTGWLAHKHCSLLEALNSGKYDLADEDFMLYDRANGKVLVGLSRRRKAEKELFRAP
jgi:lysozyme